MAALSNYLSNKLIRATLNSETFTGPDVVYIALFTSDPKPDGSGREVKDGSYIRQTIRFKAPFRGTVNNIESVTFPVATNNWGTISHVAIFDLEKGGELLFFAPILTPKVIVKGEQLTINPGDIIVGLE